MNVYNFVYNFAVFLLFWHCYLILINDEICRKDMNHEIGNGIALKYIHENKQARKRKEKLLLE